VAGRTRSTDTIGGSARRSPRIPECTPDLSIHFEGTLALAA